MVDLLLNLNFYSYRAILVYLSLISFILNIITYIRDKDLDLFCSLMTIPFSFFIYEISYIFALSDETLALLDILRISYGSIIILCLILPKLIQKYHKKLVFFMIINVLSGLMIFSPKESFDINFYIIGIYTLLFIIFISFALNRNIDFYLNVISIIFLNFVMYLYRLKNEGYRIVWDFQDICYLIFAIIAISLLIYLLILSLFKNRPNQILLRNIFYERDKDLDILIDYLSRFNSIGINSRWGDGKSFLYKMVQSD